MLYKKEDFDNYPIMDSLMKFADDFDFPTWGKNNKEEIKATIEVIKNVIEDQFSSSDKNNKEKYAFSFYPTWNSKDGLILDSAKFKVSLKYPSYKPAVEKYIKRTFSIEGDIYFFDNFLKNMGEFFDDYDHALMLQHNVEKLNTAVSYVAGHIKTKRNMQYVLNEELKGSDLAVLYKNKSLLPLVSKVLAALGDSIGDYSANPSKKEVKEFIENKLLDKIYSYELYNLRNSLKSRMKSYEESVKPTLGLLDKVSRTILYSVFDVEQDPLNISFALGDRPLLKSSETHAVLGLSEDVIKNLGSLLLFDDHRGGVYWNYVLEALGINEEGEYVDKVNKKGEVVKRKPYEFVHVDNPFVRDLNLYHRPNTSEKTLLSKKYKENKPDDSFEDFDMEGSIDVDAYLAGLDDEEDKE